MIRVKAVCLRGLDNRISVSAGISTLRRVGEQPVLSADYEVLAASFGGVVTKAAKTIFKVAHKVLTLISDIYDGFAEL